MSVLDKHPAPWVELQPLPENGGRPQLIVDGNGDTIVGVVHCEQPLWIAKEAKNLILAAPELLAALNSCIETIDFIFEDGPVRELTRPDRKTLADPRAMALALIARIERGPHQYRCSHNPGACVCDGPGSPPLLNGHPVVCDCECHRIEGGNGP